MLHHGVSRGEEGRARGALATPGPKPRSTPEVVPEDHIRHHHSKRIPNPSEKMHFFVDSYSFFCTACLFACAGLYMF